MIKKFKGSQCTMRQGSTKHDDYLIRKLPHGRWVKLIIKDFSAKEDLEALQYILRNCERVHWHESARYIQTHSNVPVMSVSEFLTGVK